MLKRFGLVVVVGALLLSLAGGVAVARTFVCSTIPCQGTENRGMIGERKGSVADRIFARGGDDDVNARRSGNDRDVIFGQGGNDEINAEDGDERDEVDCGEGDADTATVDPGEVAFALENGCETATSSETATPPVGQ